MSPAGTSVSSPIWRCSSSMSAWQKRMTSRSDFPLGLKFAPPLAPPMGSPVSAFLKVCSKPRNLSTPMSTDEPKRRPPLYGPMELLNCTRQARSARTLPASSSHATRKMTTRSGSVMRSSSLASRYSGCSRT